MGFRITTWNVNGIRNPFSYEPWRGTRTFQSMFDILESDIVVIQETKIQRKDLRDDMVLVPGWDCYFRYSGLVIYTRNSTCAPIRAEEGITGILCPPNSSVSFRDMPEELQIGGYPTLGQLRDSFGSVRESEADDGDGRDITSDEQVDAATLDSEGRCVVLEFPGFVLIGTYCPAYRDESRNSFRMDFLNALNVRVRNLVSLGKRVFVTGDINISKAPIDSAHALESIRKSATTAEDFLSSPPRKLFNALVTDGTVVGGGDNSRGRPVLHDICRSFHLDRAGMYTCWDTRLNTRPGNYGSRIDYVLCTLDMREWFVDSNIQEGLMGSDHCPVYAVFNKQVLYGGEMVHVLDVVNPPGMFKSGVRQREYLSRDILPTSGRLLPEFDLDKRQKKAATATATATTTTTTTAARQIHTSGQPFVSIDITTPRSMSGKRPPPPSSTPAKRSKSTATIPTASSTGQKTLEGFFKPRTTSVARSSVPSKNASMRSIGNTPETIRKTFSGHTASHPKVAASISSYATNQFGPDDPATLRETLPTEVSASTSNNDILEDALSSKEDWSKLFTRKPVPRCDSHQEPCISLTTKKPGVNCGRAFWICPRPLGPSGEKEKGTQWRCPTFIWAKDWNGPQ
ncbi:class II abasic (AP) endonuclease [Penicillium malachiteum]|uniref:class II abasic (AP) endonuclease n=1 Tax=Penicillium malachiteum TaxID=1324776 RepID=UPI00254941C2|nr:class II abasic (AP) endonuclease [Penicillium malachiteum]KAJ5726402.1 class II abasic (AP) endonuclease [Penicillium malachiteum]